MPYGQVEMITRGYGHPKQLAKKCAMLIFFSKEDNKGVQFPHNNAVVVILNVKIMIYTISLLIIQVWQMFCTLIHS